MYKDYLYPTWAYFGFDYNRPSLKSQILAWILAGLPALWMPLKLTRPSQLAYWVLYITVIIPSMFVPMFAGMNSSAEIALLSLCLFSGFAVLGCGYYIPLAKVRSARIPRQFFWMVFASTAICLTVWLVIAFRAHMQLVSFGEVYDLRDAANDVAEGSLVNYALMLLTGAINPFLMGYGLYFKRRWLFVAGAIGQVLIYSILGTKGSVLSIVFVPGIHLLLKFKKISFGLVLGLASLVILAGASFSGRFISSGDASFFSGIIQFVVLMRTLSMNGLLTAQYYDFFQRNPATYFSHIHVVNWFVPYPYHNTVGQEIGLAYAGTTDLNATANFWATDGIAALGLAGILFISVFCALVFWVLDSASQRHPVHLTALLTAYAAYNIANISIFTSLFSGGLALLILLIYLLPKTLRITTASSASLQLARNTVF
jgi:O-antigen polymerase